MGRKQKVYTDLKEEVESHPWLRFPETDNQAVNLIIGSFPPNKFTIYTKTLTNLDMNFFYGSKENAFWQLFIQAKKLEYKLPQDLHLLKIWLSDNLWTVTDVVKSAQRKEPSALDSDLVNVEWNVEIIKSILVNNPIRTIYFTSAWVLNKFEQHVEREVKDFQSVKVNKIVLLSPSRNGLRSAKRAKFTIYKSLEGEKTQDYRERYYSLALNN